MMSGDVKRASTAVAAIAVGAVAVGVAVPGAFAQRVGIVTASAREAPASASRLEAELIAVAAARGADAVGAPFAEAARRVGSGAIARGRLAAFSRAGALMAEGWRRYLQVKYDLALTRLAEARQVAERVIDLEGGIALYAELSLRLGAVKLELGRGAEADDDLRLAAVLDPDRPVTDEEFKRSVVVAYQAARARLRTVSRRTIEAEPGGVYAPIEIDGVEVGRAPLSVELEEGLHAIVVRAQGREPAVQVIRVRAGDDARVRFALAADPLASVIATGPEALSAGTGEQEAQIAVTALSVYAEVDDVLLAAVVWRRGAPALLGQWCGVGPVRCGGVVEIGYAKPADLPAAARRMWRAAYDQPRRFPPLLAADVRLTEAEGAPGTDDTSARARWWGSPWLWLGTAAAALGVTAVVLLGRDENVQPIVDVDFCEFSRCE
jgi:hypothetical protein